jgi:hypothetical protein
MSRLQLAALAFAAVLAATAGVASLSAPKTADAAIQPDTVTSLDEMGGMSETPTDFVYMPNIGMRDGSTRSYTKGQIVIIATVPGKVDEVALFPGWTATLDRGTKSSTVVITNRQTIKLDAGNMLAGFDVLGAIPRHGTHSMTINRSEIHLSGDIVGYGNPDDSRDNGGVAIR